MHFQTGKLGADRSEVTLDRGYGHRVYAKVRRAERDRFVCRAEHSAFGSHTPFPVGT
jgi:hypothetical protein